MAKKKAAAVEQKPTNDAIIYQFCQGELHTAMLNTGRDRLEAYAAKWDWDLAIDTDKPPHDANFGYDRFRVLLEAFQKGYQYAIYLETDVIIASDAIDFRSILQDQPMAAAWGRVPGREPEHHNTGVLFARNDPRAIAFIESVIGCAPAPGVAEETGVWWERMNCQQTVMNRILQLDKWQGLFNRLDSRFNCIAGIHDESKAYLIAWHGVEGEQKKLEAMRQWVNAHQMPIPCVQTSGTPQVCMLSFWRDDEGREIQHRMDILLDKTYPNTRYLWAVGDSSDRTEQILQERAAKDNRITVVNVTTGILGNDLDTRLRRLSVTTSKALGHLLPTDDYLIIHESDLISPPDLVERLLSTPGDVKAGWVLLSDANATDSCIFYDTWAYIGLDGQNFKNGAPYHPSFKPDQVFEVEAVGSVWMAPAADFHGEHAIRCDRYAVRDLMRQLRQRGRRVFVDPTIRITQPTNLWVAYAHAKVEYA